MKMSHKTFTQPFNIVFFFLSYKNIRGSRFYKANIGWFVEFVLSISYS